MSSLGLSVGGHLDYRGQLATLRAVEPDFVVLEVNDNIKMMKPRELYDDIENGLIETHQPSVLLVKPSPLSTAEDRGLAQKYEDYIIPLCNEESPGSIKAQRRVIEQVANKRGDFGKNRPSPSTLYRWYKDYMSDSIGRNIAAMVTPKIIKRGSQASSEALDLFWDVINEHYLKRESEGAYSRAQCFKDFKFKWEALVANSPTAEKKKLKGICRSTFYENLNKIDPVEVCIARKGWSEANRVYRSSTEHVITQRPLERVQIDAVHLNLGLRDLDGNYIGMPVVFFAIDVFTRAILGYVISYAKHRREDLCSSIELIKCIIQPKVQPEHTVNDWVLFGKPEMIQHDSGVFSSNQFQAFLMNAQITTYQNPAKKAWFNGYVERFNRTFRTSCVSKIPGYLGKRNEELKDSTNVKTVAHTTVDEFKRIVEAYILDDYHQSQHRGINGWSPAQMCEKYGHLVGMPTPEYIKRVLSFQGIEFEATLNLTTGITKHKLTYNDKAGKLQDLFNKLGGKVKGKNPKVNAYYSELDISKISVLNKFTGELLVIPCTSLREPISLAEYNAKHNSPPDGKSTKADTVSPIIDDINTRKNAEKVDKDKRKAERAKKKQGEEGAGLPPTSNTFNQLIDGNPAGHNKPPHATDAVSNLPESSKVRSSKVRKIAVKPIKL